MSEEGHSADFQGILALALGCGATRAGIVAVRDISFSESFRELCAMNHCGHYGINWMCPPAVGEFETLRNQVMQFDRGLVIQTVTALEDSFDYEGMVRAADRHEEVFRSVLQEFRLLESGRPHLPLNAGQCKYCGQCACPDSPCLFTNEAIASLEAYGIDVNALVSACGIPYNNGTATVSYAGMILF